MTAITMKALSIFHRLNANFEHLEEVASKYFEKYFHKCLDLFVEPYEAEVLKVEYAALGYDGSVKDIPIVMNNMVKSKYFKSWT